MSEQMDSLTKAIIAGACACAGRETAKEPIVMAYGVLIDLGMVHNKVTLFIVSSDKVKG